MTGQTPPQGKVAKNHLALVEPGDILRDYCITQGSRLGSEVEFMILHPDGRLINAAAREVLCATYADVGLSVTDEPLASLVEVKSNPYARSDALITEMSETRTRLVAATKQAGFTAHEIGYLGDVTLDHAYAHRIDNERMAGLLEDFRSNGHEICARQPLMTASVHLSVSYADIDHAFRIGRHMMVLTPALTAICANGGTRFDGHECDFNPTATIRLSQPHGRSGISPVIGAARDGHHMMQLQAEHIYNTPMMMHLNEQGEMRVTGPGGVHPSLKNLQARGLNTMSNALLSESMQYHLLKLTSLRNSQGDMTGKRLELRMADNGPFQHDLMAMTAEAVALKPAFGRALEEGLIKIGLNPFAPETGAMADQALRGVARHRDTALNVEFGTVSVATVGRLLIDLLGQHAPPGHPGQPALQQARRILTL